MSFLPRSIARSSLRLSSTRPLTPLLSRSVHQSGPPTTLKPTDPYPLPLDPKLHQQPNEIRQQSSLDELNEPLSMPAPIDRTGEGVDVLRARLVYQTRKRGTLEADLILGTFAKENLSKMDETELKEFDKLLDEPDWDIYYWAIQKRQPPPRWAGTPLLEQLKQHAKNEGRVVRVMPDLNDKGGL